VAGVRTIAAVPLVVLAFLAAPAGAATTITQTNDITINDAAGSCVPGAATPYPSEILVSGIGGTITDVDVSVTGLTHNFVQDVGILLVSPAGHHTMLMRFAGTNAVTSRNITFDDAAAASLPNFAPFAAGTYKPTDHGTFNCLAGSMPGPAPAAPYTASLATFNGDSPNGTWKLFVVDGIRFGAGSINEWSLSITTVLPDTTAPNTSITSGPLLASTSRNASFSFTGTDNVTPVNSLLFECSLDSAPFGPCTSSQSYSNLALGLHTFRTRAIDLLSLVDPTPASRTWGIYRQGFGQ